MNKDRYPVYGLVLVSAAAVAIWAGMPVAYLFFLGCPLMMFVMMKGMSGTAANPPTPPPADAVTHLVKDGKSR
jgi:hypothetical protein